MSVQEMCYEYFVVHLKHLKVIADNTEVCYLAIYEPEG
jgi:hypothetical protein